VVKRPEIERHPALRVLLLRQCIQYIGEAWVIERVAIDRDGDRALVVAEALKNRLQALQITRERATKAKGLTGVERSATSCDVALRVESNLWFPVEAMSTLYGWGSAARATDSPSKVVISSRMIERSVAGQRGWLLPGSSL